jgi:hypothetical protein
LGLAAGCAVLAVWPVAAEAPDPGAVVNGRVSEATGGRLKLSFEFRDRFESREGADFGRTRDVLNPLLRTRFGAQFLAADWLKVSALAQDCRAPLYGGIAPSTLRDSVDLHEAYIELFPGKDAGFGALLGREMVNLGEGRIIGVAQWTNTSRAYDTARLYYRAKGVRVEFLMLSLVKVRPDEFNRPEPGDRLWGTYNTFSLGKRGATLDIYGLRRDQNRPGGFPGPGRIGINTAGLRATGPLAAGVRYSIETAVQNGHTGVLPHRGFAWFSNVSRRFGPVEVSAEYKYASGSDRPAERDGTFDQLYASNHDKFGHLDLFGWRNIHNLRSLETWHITRPLALNFMYNDWWLASARDALYNGTGRSIALSREGSAGRHVGREADLFATYQYGPFTFGAGAAKLFPGEFLKHATPGAATRYLYVFQSFAF